MNITLAILAGFLLDLWMGDPLWLPHPVVAMGKYITAFERYLRPRFGQTKRGELVAGGVMAVGLLVLSFGIPFAALWALRQTSSLAAWLLEAFWCGQILAVKGLKDAAMKVYRALAQGDLPAARRAVSMIVGRDTDQLTAEGVAKACVETVAENFSDGVVAPLCFLLLGSAPFGFLYKAINTMDSMVGYQNHRYRYFGRIPAKLDDAANFLPARIAAMLLLLGTPCLHLDTRGAWRIFCRDRSCHKSPNSAQTEALCAGALGVALAGNASYFGELMEKPTIGDDLRPITAQDIPTVCRLMQLSAVFGLVLGLVLRLIFC